MTCCLWLLIMLEAHSVSSGVDVPFKFDFLFLEATFPYILPPTLAIMIRSTVYTAENPQLPCSLQSLDGIMRSLNRYLASIPALRSWLSASRPATPAEFDQLNHRNEISAVLGAKSARLTSDSSAFCAWRLECEPGGGYIISLRSSTCLVLTVWYP